MTADTCPSWLANDWQNDSHLVRGSRVLKHDCFGGMGLGTGASIDASECLRYATEGRYVTNEDGSRDAECDGSFVNIFLQHVRGQWYVVAEDDGLDWGGGCQPREVSFWKRRIPWP